MRNATSIGLFGASALALILGACGGGGGGGGDNGAAGSGSSTAGSGNSTAGTANAAAGSGNSTAGSSSAAGSGNGTGGSGTSGGAPACNPVPGSKKGDGTNTTIDELDDTNIMFSPAGTGMGAWDFGKDTAATAMGSITPTGTMTLMPTTGGHMGSALHVTGTGLTGWGAALAAFLNGASGAFDASDYGGVAFWIKGSTDVHEGKNKILLQARMPDVLPGAGSCCKDPKPGEMPTGIECYSGHRLEITVTGEWTEMKVPWTAFMGPAWGLGSTIPLNPNRVRDITFAFNHDAMDAGPASFDVWVDGLRFLKKDEMGNIGGGSGGSSSGGSASGGSGGTGGSGGANGGTGGN